MMKRDIKALKYVKKKRTVIIEKGNHPFSKAELDRLAEQGLLCCMNCSIPQGEGEYPLTGNSYTITSRGKDAISEHRSSTVLAIVTLIAAVVSAILAILTEIRALLPAISAI